VPKKIEAVQKIAL